MVIATSICVNVKQHENSSIYPQLADLTAAQRRLRYWECAVAFMATSLRCNPGDRHVLYTNDEDPAILNGQDLRAFLTGKGVDVRYLPFTRFRPPAGHSRTFHNAFYKLDATADLCKQDDAILLLDSDCIWVRPVGLRWVGDAGESLIMYDRYGGDTTTRIDGFTQAELAGAYKLLMPQFPATTAVHFGGEIVGGAARQVRRLIDAVEQVFAILVGRAAAGPVLLSDKISVFDGDEFVMSMAMPVSGLPWRDSGDFIRRIWTTYNFNNTQPSDMQLTVWHVPAEKDQGIPPLVRWIVQPNSSFWILPPAELPGRLGGYLGIGPGLRRPARYAALARKWSAKVVSRINRKLRASR